MGVSPAYLGQLRSGARTDPSYAVIDTIARYFGVTPDYFSSDDETARRAGASILKAFAIQVDTTPQRPLTCEHKGNREGNEMNFRYYGTCDDIQECQHCGRTELKKTVMLQMLDADGNPEELTYYGTSCAARALGVKAAAVTRLAIEADTRRADALEMSREMMAFFDSFCKDGRGPHANFNRMVSGYVMHGSGRMAGTRAKAAIMTIESLARHLTVIETNGASAL